MTKNYDAVVVGSGPNGLSAAIKLAKAGLSVLVLESRDTIGGGMRSAELTLPGYTHDVCATIHTLAQASPFFRTLFLSEHELEWIFPPASAAHPLDGEPAVMVERTVEATSLGLGEDGAAYRRLIKPFITGWDRLIEDVMGPFPFPPRTPFLMARLGLLSIWPAVTTAKAFFKGKRARAAFAGMAGHSMLPLDRAITSGFGILLTASANMFGWPIARGGSQRIAEALACELELAGGEIITGQEVKSIDELPPARAILFDVSPRQLVKIAGKRLPEGYQRSLESYRYGPGIFKMDWALSEPAPWKDPGCLRTATVHLGGTLEEVAASERAVWRGEHAEKPYVIFAQPSLFDPSRAPAGKHTAWAYCHVPQGSTIDMSARIEDQIERFAPGFRDTILARSTRNSREMEAYNPNYVGGDINTGVQDLGQFFTRPVASLNPYATPGKGIYLCSSATPPGGGVHGMCGYHAARTVLRREFGIRS